MVRLIAAPLRQFEAFAACFGEGDFTARIDERRRDEFGRLATHFNAAVEKIRT